MSTLPGPETWRDAGLSQVDPGGDVEITPDVPRGRDAAVPVGSVAADADPADVAEQAQTVAPDTDPGGPLGVVDVLAEANPADLAEQARSVPPDERDEYP
ncbi:hypothetical protein [Cellulomonas aerilata]|uniref:Uncharacterized protein n=1 Tax=Cellulomonas aerilata TaxID=515326 RepID=A0A512DE44_9CELL|nr:hypothetical protein [Cellulomonas aerilata]GEO34742.1 hypothetical protein CAE01nite_24670 [Cellulomonas aerilata]